MVVRDLWAGADVRWIGPETVRAGAPIHPGDRAVVVDAGRHRVRSFGSLYAPAGTRPTLPIRGVTIRMADGGEVAVPRKHLEVVAPAHPLAPEPDGTQAAWWLEQLEPWGRPGLQVSSLIPSSFPSVCQVFHPWWASDTEPISWQTVAQQLDFSSVTAFDATRELFSIPAAQDAGYSSSPGALDIGTATTLVELLTVATTTPDDAFVAVWEGWGDAPPQRFPGAAHLDTPGRGHFLLRGPLTGALDTVSATGGDRPAAGLWWPTDRSWFVATEIEFEWTFVAGEQTLIDRLLADDRLEVARTTFDAAANHAVEPS